MDDLIRRQDAIDTIHNYFGKRLETLPTRMTEDGEVYADIKEMYKILEQSKVLCGMIKHLPSAQPDNRLTKIADLVEGTIDHFDLDDAMDLLYQIKDVIGEEHYGSITQ